MPTTLPLRLSTPRSLAPSAAFPAVAAGLLIVVALVCAALPVARFGVARPAAGGSCGLVEEPCALLAP